MEGLFVAPQNAFLLFQPIPGHAGAFPGWKCHRGSAVFAVSAFRCCLAGSLASKGGKEGQAWVALLMSCFPLVYSELVVSLNKNTIQSKSPSIKSAALRNRPWCNFTPLPCNLNKLQLMFWSYLGCSHCPLLLPRCDVQPQCWSWDRPEVVPCPHGAQQGHPGC